ncbi:MAG TPA: hypothetical protein VGQ36_20655 [Thermoanaerobaculia bacterium]|jgi:hypothetical protein|nr:hypothetical protein [Thermoanaerobaculia bacterium]
MNVLLLILALAGDPATCPMHAKHTAVDERGDRVMGFSHEKTKHSFKLHDDGGAVEVRANDESDAESVAAIRAHLKEIAKDFTAGNFAKPKEIHDREPDGVAVMKELGPRVTYVYEELERGARVRIKTTEARGIDAVHEFLRFQIEDHRTGDSAHLH